MHWLIWDTWHVDCTKTQIDCYYTTSPPLLNYRTSLSLQVYTNYRTQNINICYCPVSTLHWEKIHNFNRINILDNCLYSVVSLNCAILVAFTVFLCPPFCPKSFTLLRSSRFTSNTVFFCRCCFEVYRNQFWSLVRSDGYRSQNCLKIKPFLSKLKSMHALILCIMFGSYAV